MSGEQPLAKSADTAQGPLPLLTAKGIPPESERTRQIIGSALSAKRKIGFAEKLAEGSIFLISFSSVAVVFLIFIFIAREAGGVITQRLTTAQTSAPQEAAAASKDTTAGGQAADKLDPEKIAALAGMTPAEVKELDAETLAYLLDSHKEETTRQGANPDRKINALSYRWMIFPRQWHGDSRPTYSWDPSSPESPKFNIMPLIVGTVKCTLIAMLFAAPLSILSAIYVSQMAPHWLRQIVKPLVELLAGIPSVVLGFFALMVMAVWFEWLFGVPAVAGGMRALFGAGWTYTRLNATVAGVALGLAVIPIVFTISEDALRAVPNSYKEAATALGASKFETTLKIVVPAALPGIFAALVLGFGRAVGETMIVWMASGMARVVSFSPTDSTRTITSSIAAELAETVRGGSHYQMLFFLGTLLFVITFASTYAGGAVITRMKRKMTGGRG